MSKHLPEKITRSRASSPVHVFVDKETPVHVYVDKAEKVNYNPGCNSSKATKVRRPRKPGSNIPISKLMGSANNRVRSISPPWIPPPGKTTKSRRNPMINQYFCKYNFKTSKSPIGSFHNEAETESNQKDYEQQIKDLLDEVEDLREQLENEKKQDRVHESQNDENGELKEENDSMEKENNSLQNNLRKSRSNMNLNQDSDRLLELLIETELAIERSGHQMQHVFDFLKTFFHEGHEINCHDIDRIRTLFHDTESRLFDFKSVNLSLRELLKEFQQKEIIGHTVLERENTFLIKKQKDFQENISNLQQDIRDKDRLIEELRKQLAIKNEESINFNSTHDALESLKGHLQQQLKQKSGDCNRLSVQIRTLESELVKERLDKENLIELLKSPKTQSYNDRETLKKAARAQKQRALKAEESIQELTSLLAEKERQIEEILIHFGKETTSVKNSGQYQFENNDHESLDTTLTWSTNPDDQGNMRDMVEYDGENQHFQRRLENDNQEKIIVNLKRENENLRSLADQCESRLRDVEKEMKNLQRTLSDDNEDPNDEQNFKLSKLLEKLEISETSNQANQLKLEELGKKIVKLENQNADMKSAAQQKDSSVMDNRYKIDDLARENASLMRQLETALTDSKRNVDNSREVNFGKDRHLKSRVRETESQLAQQQAETNKWRRTCEETERKCNSKLHDIATQLEHAENTNRSLQTYVQFLKKSYLNVFGDLPGLSGINGTSAPYLGQTLGFSGL